MQKITLWTTSKKITTAFIDLYWNSILWTIDDSANDWKIKWVMFQNNTSWAIVYFWFLNKTATTAWWFPVAYWETITFDKAQLSQISFISDTAGTDVRWAIV